MASKATWSDWKGRPARYKGTPGNWHTQVHPPEWAFCPAWQFEELRYEAWFRRLTLEQMQGSWDYRASHTEDDEL